MADTGESIWTPGRLAEADIGWSHVYPQPGRSLVVPDGYPARGAAWLRDWCSRYQMTFVWESATMPRDFTLPHVTDEDD